MRLNEVANRMEMLLRFGLGHVNAGATVPAELEELLIVGELEAIRLQELIVLPNWKVRPVQVDVHVAASPLPLLVLSEAEHADVSLGLALLHRALLERELERGLRRRRRLRFRHEGPVLESVEGHVSCLVSCTTSPLPVPRSRSIRHMMVQFSIFIERHRSPQTADP